MSDKIYNLEEIVKKLQYNLEIAQLEFELWDKVTLNFTKSNENFKNLQKNFNNAAIHQENYEPSEYKEICVLGRDKKGYMQSFSLKCYEYEETEYTKEKIEYETWRKPIYLLTVDGIITKIYERKDQLKKQIENYNKQIEIAPTVFENVQKQYTILGETINNLTKEVNDPKYGTSSLKYLLRDYIETNLYKI